MVVSDNESWVDAAGKSRSYSGGTRLMEEFRLYQRRNPGARLVCMDLQPYGTTQAPDAPQDVLNVGGFSDAVFDQLARFVKGELGPDHWVGEIKKISLG